MQYVTGLRQVPMSIRYVIRLRHDVMLYDARNVMLFLNVNFLC